MSVKTELIAFAVRTYVNETGPARNTDSLDTVMANLFGLETPEERRVRELTETVVKVIDQAKKIRTNRQFRKIVKHV